MEMEFNKENIGKFVLISGKGLFPKNALPEFGQIYGYDFIHDKYLVRRSNYPVYADDKLYTLDEALAEIDKSIATLEEEAKTVFHDFANYEHIVNTETRANYRNELGHLWNAYYTTYLQAKVCKGWANKCNDYDTEAKKAQKGMRRLEKRINFFFGTDGEKVKKMIISSGGYENFSAKFSRINSKIENLKRQKETLRRESEVIAKKFHR